MTQTAQDMKSYKKQLREALRDPFLRSALDKFNTAYRENRPQVYAGVDFEGIRDEIARGKDAALPRLVELFEAFKRQAEAAGAVVHSAGDAREANRIIAAIARENGVRHIVKSKSMTAEETFLNDHLAEEGFQVTETDLGEWIIQLRKEGPSHMVLPAIHLSRYQVGDLFAQVTRERQDPEDIDRLVKVARKRLRPVFLEADMGVTGANFAVADSGTLGLVTNEGNMRLATTLPRVHVALVGYDKLVPDLKTALRILKVLAPERHGPGPDLLRDLDPRGTMPACPRRPGKRSCTWSFWTTAAWTWPKTRCSREALRCIRCGACANVCPVYSKVGGHKYGHVYIGAIGLILTLFYHGRENDRAIVQNCINCQACREVCPVNIDLPHLIKKTHRAVLKAEGKKPVKNIALSTVMKNRRLFHFLLRQAHLAQRPLARKGPMIRHLPHFFQKTHGFRSLPVIARTPFRDLWKRLAWKTFDPQCRVALFAGCAVDFIYPEQASALVAILKESRVDAVFPQGQTCCGLPAMMATEEETARAAGAPEPCGDAAGRRRLHPDPLRLLRVPSRAQRSQAVQRPSTAPSGPQGLHGQGHRFQLVSGQRPPVPTPRPGPKRPRDVAYHAPCHLCRGLRVVREPRRLIEAAGHRYVPSENEDVCCGFGGSYSVDFPEISAAILEKKLDGVERSGADVLVTDCPGCVLQLRGGMDRRGGRVRVMHIAELLARGTAR